MGVVHKLKEEVVSFIIAQKTSNPSVSVRHLAVLTSQQFQIKVSKSSVNGVLKNSALSSSVGRRAGARLRSEKFTIPPNKKKEISRVMTQAGFSKDVVFPQEGQPLAQCEEIIDTKIQNVVREDIQSADVQSDPVGDIEPHPDFIGRVQQLRQDKKNQQGADVDGIGFIFLKAAQWEISNKSLMGNLLKKYIEKPVTEYFDAASDMFLFFKFLGIETMDHISVYQNHGLWGLNNFCGTTKNEGNAMMELQRLFQWAKVRQGVPVFSNFILDYNQEKDRAFLEVKGFKFILEDESELIVDAAMFSVGTSPIVLGARQTSLPLNKAMTWLSNYIISNNHPPIFQKIPGETKFDRSFYEIISIFENLPGKKIHKIGVLNEKDEVIAEFSTIPSQKRSFLAGVGPGQNEFLELIKSVKWAAKKFFYHKETDRVVYFTETKSEYLAEQLKRTIPEFRVITLWNDREVAPYWAVLTNQRKGTSEEILEMYFSRWPYTYGMMPEMAQFRYEQRDALFSDRIFDDFSGIFNDFMESLHRYCQKHFFSENWSKINMRNLMPIIYDIPGWINISQRVIRVVLKVATTSSYRKDLEYAVYRVNESYIFDYLGRRLWLEI